MSLFLDGLSPAVPPEPEPARSVAPPTVEDSFEDHFQRRPDSVDAKASDDGADVNERDVVVSAEQPRAAGEVGPHDTHEDDSSSVQQDAAHEQESNPPEIEPADEPLVAHVEIPIENSSPETLDETELPALDDASPLELTVVAESEGSVQFGSAESHASVPLADQTTEKEQGKVAHPANAQTRSEYATAGEPVNVAAGEPDNVAAGEPDNVAAGEPDNVATGEPLDASTVEASTVEAEPVDATASSTRGDPSQTVSKARSDARIARHDPHAETLPVVAAETAIVGKQASVAAESAAVESAVGVLATQHDTKVEATPEIESISPAPVEGKPDAAATSPQDRFAQQLMSVGGERTARTSAAGDIHQTRFVDRVARAFRLTGGQGGTIKLRLHPPELGVLQVQLKVQGNALTAKLEAETPAARALLIDSLPVLRERLAEQGVRIEQFDVDLMERHPQKQPDGTGERFAGEGNADGPTATESSDDDSVSSEPDQIVSGENQQLNIIV